MISINRMDCMELMTSMGGGEVDLIVTDPPYLFKSLSGGGIAPKRTYFQSLNKMDEGIGDEQLDEFIRVLKEPNLYLWGNWPLIQQYLRYFADKKVNTNLLTWHKLNPAPLCSNNYLKDTEYCLYVRGKGVKLYGGYADHKTYWLSSNNDIRQSKTGHPAVKPLEIISQMVKNSSLEGQTVFDPYLGSGTTAVACKMLNRNCIGCEIEEKYISLINNRLNAVNEGKWF